MYPSITLFIEQISCLNYNNKGISGNATIKNPKSILSIIQGIALSKEKCRILLIAMSNECLLCLFWLFSFLLMLYNQVSSGSNHYKQLVQSDIPRTQHHTNIGIGDLTSCHGAGNLPTKLPHSRLKWSVLKKVELSTYWVLASLRKDINQWNSV